MDKRKKVNLVRIGIIYDNAFAIFEDSFGDFDAFSWRLQFVVTDDDVAFVFVAMGERTLARSREADQHDNLKARYLYDLLFKAILI